VAEHGQLRTAPRPDRAATPPTQTGTPRATCTRGLDPVESDLAVSLVATPLITYQFTDRLVICSGGTDFQPGRKARIPILALLLFASVGTTLLIASLRNESDDWFSGLLVEFGSAFLLFSPLLLVGKYFERRFRVIEHAQAEIQRRQSAASEKLDMLSEGILTVGEELQSEGVRLSSTVRDRLEKMWGKPEGSTHRTVRTGACQPLKVIGNKGDSSTGARQAECASRVFLYPHGRTPKHCALRLRSIGRRSTSMNMTTFSILRLGLDDPSGMGLCGRFA
jgi:hypothetical protein